VKASLGVKVVSGRNVLASFVIVASALAGAPAFAQSVDRSESAESAWYERFTASVAPSPAQKGWAGSEAKTSLFWAPSSKWGVRVDVRSDRSASPTREDEAAVGAFYQFTPSLRVGGQVSVTTPPVKEQRLAPAARLPGQADQAEAGVKLESAFKF
jgi:hypothetical protein